LRNNLYRVLAIVILLSILTACQKNVENVQQSAKEIACLRGPSAITMLKLMEEAEEYNYHISIYNTPEEIIGRIIKKEINVAAIPLNLASILYHKTQRKIKVIASGASGNLFILSRDGNLNSPKDFKGKTLNLAGKGAVPEYVFRHVMQKYSISDDIKLEYISSHAQVASLLLAGKCDCALLPEPFATEVLFKDSSVSKSVDITKEWKNINGAEPPMGCLIADVDFVNNNAEVERFLELYKKSFSFVNENLEAAASLCEKYNVMGKDVAIKAISECGINSLNKKQSMEEFLQILHSLNPESVGGSLPDEEFYSKFVA
jgi:NitT/TauT family transport system substrate-binding protein